MTTNIEKRRGLITPKSKPMFSTISSTNPRVFIRMPSAALSRQCRPASFAATAAPPELADRCDGDDQAAQQPIIGGLHQPN